MLSPYRNQPNTNNNDVKSYNYKHPNNLNREHEHKRLQLSLNELKIPQMTSSDLAKPETNTEAIAKRTYYKRNENILKTGSVNENIGINDECLDEILQKNNL